MNDRCWVRLVHPLLGLLGRSSDLARHVQDFMPVRLKLRSQTASKKPIDPRYRDVAHASLGSSTFLAIVEPIASDAVAPGEGAFTTWRMPGPCSKWKSSTSLPSGNIA